ncbi:hypothetical protein THAOC_32407 [Thalassiosira oceanica]|uniref:Uncharacterized protein n=1 Tax=Thalassiosira oceanica TaxID=159749 RepID=K0RQ08_THAOC|nr:hypothetical protein THAOC_32407 [Thalassiosira oceanica]|eukprot:EJK48767.1 hypothetical protein THAOC_32407 [Thalassiosira oceanica]
MLRLQPGLPIEGATRMAEGEQRLVHGGPSSFRQAGSCSTECGTAGSSGGGGSVRDSAHNPTRGKDVHTGMGYFQILGSRARGDNVLCPDNEKGPPRRRRRVERTYADGSTYYGFISGGKLRRTGNVDTSRRRARGRHTATNTKLKNGARGTLLVVFPM